MIFAVIDYLQYVRRRGRYGEYQNDGMALAYLGGVPKEVVSQLWTGDLIFTQRLDSWFSWALMYFTSSSVDHTAIYAGDGKIAHMTLSGFKKHYINVFGKNTRVLIVRLAPAEMTPDSKPGFEALTEKESLGQDDNNGRPLRSPAWLKFSASRIAARIVLGFHPERFRWKFLFDLVVVAIVLDTLTIAWTRFPVCTGIASAVSLLAATNFAHACAVGWNARPGKPLAHPDQIHRYFYKCGGLMFTNLGPLVVSDFGLLPLKVFRALARKRAEDSPQDQFQAVGEDTDDILKRWNVPYTLYDPEDRESDENNDEEIEKRSDSRRQAGE